VLGIIKSVVMKHPAVREILGERDSLRMEVSKQGFVSPGHFYSPIPSLAEVRNDERRIFESVPRELPGIDLRESKQLELLKDLVQYYVEMPFQPQKIEGLRYYFENPAYSYSDGILLHCMIRILRPKRMIEIGSGYSSCVTLDTNERFFEGSISTTFIEPYPELLLSLIHERDRKTIEIIPRRLQDVELSEFDRLEENDILFVDSTHVSKVGSDVNRIVFDILPRLAPGVHVHFHDIFYPFEYPKEWIYQGRAWNEAYLLRAFLQYNASFCIVLMNTMLERYHEAFFLDKMPLCLRNPGGSLWIRKCSGSGAR
jgi:Methyltransferase domain